MEVEPETEDELPEPPAYFITIRWHPDQPPVLDIGDIDDYHAIGLLRGALRQLEDQAPCFDQPNMEFVLITDDDEDEEDDD